MYLVTGGAGFIGSNLVEYLLAQGEAVRVLDDFSTGHERNLEHLKGEFELVRGSILDEVVLERAMQGIKYVLHQAAISSVPRSLANPVVTNDVNVRGTLNVFISAHKAHVERVVYASSSSVYGDSPTLPKIETMPTMPKSIYAASKLICEHYAKVFSTVFGLSTIGLRYFNVFGPRQDPNSTYAAVIPIFIKMISQGSAPPLHGGGLQTRDFSYIDNVVQANVKAATAINVPPGIVCNIACGEQISISKLFDRIKEILGSDVVPLITEPRLGDVKDSLADISLSYKIIKYKPIVDLSEGLKRTVDYMIHHPD